MSRTCTQCCLCKIAQALEPAKAAAARRWLVWALAAAAASLSMVTLAVYCAALAACSRLGGLSAGTRGAGRLAGLCASRMAYTHSTRRRLRGRATPGCSWAHLACACAVVAWRCPLRVRGQAGCALRPGRARPRQAPRRSSCCGRTSSTARASTRRPGASSWATARSTACPVRRAHSQP